MHGGTSISGANGRIRVMDGKTWAGRRGREDMGERKKRILFYGGCHAATFKGIFARNCPDPDYAFDCIVNFELIASRAPFPYERLKDYEYVVFSPIENKEDYNTEKLLSACREEGIRTIVYPWLQWNGYFPYIRKGPFLTTLSWQHGLFPGFGALEDFDAFADAMSSALSDSNALDANLLATTERLRAQETRTGCDITVSDYILGNYARRRLFLTPDHPSKILYDYLAAELSGRLGVPLRESFFWSTFEPQHGIRIPIPPEVGTSLGLDFVDADYQNTLTGLGQRHVCYDEYQRISFGVSLGYKIYRSSTRTFIKHDVADSKSLPDSEKLAVPKGCLVQILPTRVERSHVVGRINWASGANSEIKPWRLPVEGAIFAPHWKASSGNSNRWH